MVQKGWMRGRIERFEEVEDWAVRRVVGWVIWRGV